MFSKPRFLAVALLLIALTSSAQAAFVTYTDRASFQAALGTFQTETFNSSAVQTFGNPFNVSGFNGFSLSGSTGGDNIGIRTGSTAGNIDGTQFLGWQQGNGGLGPVINFNLSQPVNGFGFDWTDTDPTDEYELSIDGTNFFNPPFSSGTGRGFFGVISDSGPFTTATIRNATGQGPGGFINPFGVDNVTTSSASVIVSTVPAPAGLVLLGSAMPVFGFVGLMGRFRRRQ